MARLPLLWLPCSSRLLPGAPLPPTVSLVAGAASGLLSPWRHRRRLVSRRGSFWTAHGAEPGGQPQPQAGQDGRAPVPISHRRRRGVGREGEAQRYREGDRVLALDAAYPLPLLPGMLDKFPKAVEPTRWWPKKKLAHQSIVLVLKAKDEQEFVSVGKLALKLNRGLTMAGPTLAGTAALAAAFIGSGEAGTWASGMAFIGSTRQRRRSSVGRPTARERGRRMGLGARTRETRSEPRRGGQGKAGGGGGARSRRPVTGQPEGGPCGVAGSGSRGGARRRRRLHLGGGDAGSAEWRGRAVG